MMISFGSDNHAGIHPKILLAFTEASEPFAASYGMDSASQELQTQLRETLNAIDSHIVFNGTAANVLGIGCALKSYESVLCTDVSHLNVDECGAPEKMTGCKLQPLPHKNGKLSVATLEAALIRRGDQHYSQIKMVSLTQPTELGTVYTLDELKAIRAFCDKNKLYLHIDGARLANACYFLNCTFKDILQYADVSSVGGAKNGLLVGELVVIHNKELKEGFKFLRKQYLQLPSKTRFLARQFQIYFSDNTWKDIAHHQHNLALKLHEQLLKMGIKANYPIESNAVFCNLPKPTIKNLRQTYFFYVWDEKTQECRLMTSFATTAEHIENFTQALYTALHKAP
ncbi:MAG: aminotransferase class I/II-fold pyridoxal phosphate-dependent enzyme [Bdellovibrionaceae bacterium]|nr:aminotransferase class I/II-fold pyridoxal phosphate-dependent enzyme [Pseudobdellovibrionaceae bacterium]